ncbi:MAG: hypothetical protein M1814_003549 [Vezdaea aestivalis]|nr:MAG: hypothetical protein M1814_003549 [Vezdaea aestivalis]
MPRLPPHLLHRACSLSPHLPSLLRVTRNLSEAQNELRWLTEAAASSSRQDSLQSQRSARSSRTRLERLIHRRAAHEPLQYILGTTEVGGLEFECRKGVLIPRWETASLADALARRLRSHEGQGEGKELRVLDLCSGAGTLALLLAHYLPAARVLGVDISPSAITLARTNLRRFQSKGELKDASRVEFRLGDLFKIGDLGRWDVLTANPPYVPVEEWRRLGRSVRAWEPKGALVPEDPDGWRGVNRRVWEVGRMVRVGVVLVEVGSREMARALAGEWIGVEGVESVEVWRDWPEEEGDEERMDVGGGREVRVRGRGQVRGVFVRRKGGVV